MSNEQPARRSSHIEMPVAYAAVGASKAPDLVRFPPDGTTSYEETLRLGSGQERFLLASSLLMTWGAQRGSGVTVADVVRGSGDRYTGVSFDDDGQPQAGGEVEEQFGPDGEPYLVAGTTAVLRAPGQQPRNVLIVYTVDEERRSGFAWGTSDEAGAVGEQLFMIEHRDDDTVWAVARGFLSAPKSGLLGLKARADLRAAVDAVKAQLAALAPGAGAVDPSAAPQTAAPQTDADAAADAGADPGVGFETSETDDLAAAQAPVPETPEAADPAESDETAPAAATDGPAAVEEAAEPTAEHSVDPAATTDPADGPDTGDDAEHSA
ncbi:DUF1990 family protein [Leucobacter muris]|jgi:uncharacterized protein (UPF0548 family)|uniref:DUF1990 family protein n=1 Tax=Leucobacter muris TaxID=1935379 RepID=UPI001E2F61C1|nr:DUF1990 family protein [Leucobacter muris]